MQMIYTCKTYRSDNCWTALDDLMWFCHPCSLLLIIQIKELCHSITCTWNSCKNYLIQAVSHQAITKTLCYVSWPSLASPFSNYPNHTFWGSVAISTSHFSNYPNHTFWNSVACAQSSCKDCRIQAARYLMIGKHLSSQIPQTLSFLINIETYRKLQSFCLSVTLIYHCVPILSDSSYQMPCDHDTSEWPLLVASIVLPFSCTDVSLCSHPVRF